MLRIFMIIPATFSRSNTTQSMDNILRSEGKSFRKLLRLMSAARQNIPRASHSIHTLIDIDVTHFYFPVVPEPDGGLWPIGPSFPSPGIRTMTFPFSVMSVAEGT